MRDPCGGGCLAQRADSVVGERLNEGSNVAPLCGRAEPGADARYPATRRARGILAGPLGRCLRSARHGTRPTYKRKGEPDSKLAPRLFRRVRSGGVFAAPFAEPALRPLIYAQPDVVPQLTHL